MNAKCPRGTRVYAPTPTKRPATKHELPGEVSARIHALYFPFLTAGLTDAENERILSAVEEIITKVQKKARGANMTEGL